jgi:hypothetical protein
MRNQELTEKKDIEIEHQPNYEVNTAAGNFKFSPNK